MIVVNDHYRQVSLNANGDDLINDG